MDKKTEQNKPIATFWLNNWEFDLIKRLELIQNVVLQYNYQIDDNTIGYYKHKLMVDDTQISIIMYHIDQVIKHNKHQDIASYILLKTKFQQGFDNIYGIFN